MKKILAILLCSVMTLSLAACGDESKEKQVGNNVTEVVDNNNNQTDSNVSIAEPSNDMIVGSWYCDEIQEIIDFTSTEAITATTPMDNISGSYRLEGGKLIATFDMGDDIYEYEVSDSTLILKNNDGVYTFIRVTSDFAIENAFAINVDANLLSVIVYEPNEADIRCQLEKRLQGSISIYLDGTPYMLLYADLGDGFYARVCNSDNGSILDTITYDISDTEIVFHADMSSYKDFSFEAVSGYTTCIDYDGNGGGMISYAVKDVVKHEERANTIAESTETSETSTAKGFDISKIVGHYFNTLGNQNKPDELVVEEAFGGPSYHFVIYPAYDYMNIASGGGYDYTGGFDPSEVSSSADGSWKISLPTNAGYEADFTINADGSIDVLVTGNSTTYNGHFVNSVDDFTYLETKYSDGVNTIVFHGTDPIHPTAMTINGNKITFDSVVVAQNDEYYIHLGLNWTYDNISNQGDMHYDRDNQHIVLKGFAIANEYVPVE